MAEKINEIDILERLNEAPSVRGFFITTVEVLAQAIDTLIQRIFRKDNFAVQSVVGPLLDDTGPLGNLSVRLKLLYGLGVIADDVYHDIETIIKLRNQLNSDGAEYLFTDSKILAAIEALHLVQNMGLLQLNPPEPDEDIDLEFYHLHLQRQQQVIRSGLSLAIIEICNELNKESPF
ncbi:MULTISPECIES: MltR family transcriptional regulator [unclassified Vibrio]|uniref:MltR family transcriptional regulator n=2 Tax=Vibrio TaxID=662 RepID=UPI0013728456|nr:MULTISPECIES: MltR family transcriptional regulator [unclassified Vibrio]NAW68289.1 MltR family transcriptional regulator [Vibrio sp. V28_P6S34P95]NAX05864.1 MltR family transcriptional regulator [Vibrio sp. V30_P3S12P165]NAX33316.1 MltR family transcriptional regulator [Vibrio sp. V29_P1S30P107]NAX36529.1 MltR family transcriptional regulator [Vibrio sp. V27_P1S3P104]NAX39725.1 MltR family transcriptional regulator [Vibrio sp. V26_P1S5P106]